MLIRSHITDRKAYSQGKWFTYDGSQFLIAAAGTPEYNRELQKQGKEHKRELRKGGEKADLAVAELTTDVLAKTILLDWKELKDINAAGEEVEVPYSLEVAYKLLRECQGFRQWLENTCMDLQNFVLEEEATAAGELKSGDAVGNGVRDQPGLPAGAGGSGPGESAASPA